MKEYIVRMIDTAFDHTIVDGSYFTCESPENAVILYKARCRELGIPILSWYAFEVFEYAA